MKKFIKYILVSLFLVLGININAQITGNLQVTGTFTFDGNTFEVAVNGDTLASLEALRLLFEPIFAIPTDTSAAVYLPNGSKEAWELMEISTSSDLIYIRGNGTEPNIPTNSEALWIDTVNTVYIRLTDYNNIQLRHDTLTVSP